MVVKFHGNVRGEVRVNFLARFASKPHIFMCGALKFQGRKKQHKHKLFGPDFLRTFLTLTPECPGVKSFSPSPGPQENALFGADVHDFRRGRP